MATPFVNFNLNKVFLLHLVLFLFTSSLLLSASLASQFQSKHFPGKRRMLATDEDDQVLPKKKPTKITTSPTKNQTKLIKPHISTKNQSITITPKVNLSSKNQTKLVKPTNSTKEKKPISLSKFDLKKLNSTSKPTKKSLDLLLKEPTSKNKTTKPITQHHQDQNLKSEKPKINQIIEKKPKQQKTQKPIKPNWIEDDEEDDFVSEFRDLPTKFHQTLIPDLEKFSTTSKAYLTIANNEITKGFKPIVGKEYAPTIASIVSCAFLLIPLLLVSLIFNRIKAYFSLQKILIFIQVYLSIYFSILCLSAIVTGLEPLKFFYATSMSTYVCLQVLQTLGYVLYLLLLLMYLILVFSTDCGLGSKLLGLAQTIVGLAIGLHYYMAVFHRVVLHQPPKTNWKIHGIYATCYFVICLFATAERRKKAYLEEGGEEGKKS